METLLPLAKMSKNEKLIAMEELWDDISKNDDIDSPAWHKNILEERTKKFEAGEEKYIEFSEVKRRVQLKLNR